MAPNNPSGVNEEAAFSGVGDKLGLQIWCIQNSRLIPIPKSCHGKFYSGNCYIVLNTVERKSRNKQHDVHFWVGEDSDELDAELASGKAVELDAALGSCTVQYLELQGSESNKFLSYFKPCIMPAKGEISSAAAGGGGGFDNTYPQTRLLKCKGGHAVHVTQVPFSRSSLNHNDVFILETQAKISLFCGANSSIQERARGLDVVQYIIDHEHAGRCEISTIVDGKFGDRDTVEFWSLFGGYAPLPRIPSTDLSKEEPSLKQLYRIDKGKIIPFGAVSLERKALDTYKCYMLDCGADIFVWMGRNTMVTERKMSMSAAEDFVHSQGRSASTHLTFFKEGLEAAQFKSHFEVWAQTAAPSLYEEGREKVAAIFKYQGYDVKEIPDESACRRFIELTGTLKVWLVDSAAVTLVPASEQRKFYSGDCYVVQYTYQSGEKTYCLFYTWFGRKSTMEDKADAISLMDTMIDSTKGHIIMAQVAESQEPSQFLAIFHKFVIFKGGRSSRFIRSNVKSGCTDDLYDKNKRALFRVQGTGPDFVQAIQVDLVSSSLNSAYCYILQHEAFMYAWAGNLSRECDLDLVYRMLHLINPLKQPMAIREGTEPDTFQNAIGAKMEYPREKENKSYTNGPHLFCCTLIKGNFKGYEIFNFCQDDLNTEDVLVLDNFNELYIWVGQHAFVTSTMEAFIIGKKFLEANILLEGLSLDTAMYVVTEGSEPPFFTCFFDWDSTKTNMHGNSFERKLAILRGLAPPKLKPGSSKSPWRSSLKASLGFGSSFSPWFPGGMAHRASGNTKSSTGPAHTVSNKRPKDQSLASLPVKDQDSRLPRKVTTGVHHAVLKDSKKLAPKGGVEAVTGVHEEGKHVINDLKTFPYHLLKVPTQITLPEIDVTRREAYLSDEEFQEKFGMTKESFYKLPLWRQKKLKMALHLF